MRYLLDSNAWIALFRHKSATLLARLQAHPESEIVLCSVVLAELWYGAVRSGPGNVAANKALVEQIRARYSSIPFDDDAGMEYAAIRAHLVGLGQTIGPNDLMIAAIARAHAITVVTHNVGEFSRVPGLLVEDWQTS